jgi:hypothetical protein
MAQRHQRGWLKKEERAQGETWVLFFRTTRKSDGKRVEYRCYTQSRLKCTVEPGPSQYQNVPEVIPTGKFVQFERRTNSEYD